VTTVASMAAIAGNKRLGRESIPTIQTMSDDFYMAAHMSEYVYVCL